MAEKLIPQVCIGRKMHIQILAVIFTLFLGLTVAEEVCKFTYKGQPEHLNDSTIVVNEKMVAMSKYIYVGTPKGSVPVQVSTPTIFFVIDNSTSMSSGMGGNPMDKWGNRFNVTRDLIDTLYAKFPKAEVGFAAFRKYLYLDPTDSDQFVQCPQQAIGAYIPLLRLDSSYAPAGEMGYEILKKWLETDTITGNNPYVNLSYIPSNINDNRSGTNINSGFDAAKHAMLSSQYAKECHYVIFLSDGAANQPPYDPDAYVEGTGVPTTFTIFFTRDGNAPQDLIDFTDNVQTNGYSTNNPSSNLWAFENTEYDTLMKFIMDSVLTVINQTQTSYPTDIAINGIDPVGSWDSTGFTFADLFPLEGETTPFVFDIDYHIFVDSITEIGDTITVEKDTSTHTEFEVVIEDGAPDLPDTFKVECWGRNLEFCYNGSEVSSVNETMEEIEIRFSEYQVDWLYGYTGVKVEVTHTKGSSNDKENYTLENKGSYWAYTFPRVIDSTPDVGDGTLQHHATDSIVAVFRNPKLPLDTLRVTVPFLLSGVIAVECAYYFDRDAEGHIDSIYIKVDGDLTDDMVKEIIDSDILTLPAFREFEIKEYDRVSGGIALIVEQDLSKEPITYVTDEDSIAIKETILNQGGWVMGGKVPVFDKVAPIIVYKNLKYEGETYRSPFVIDFQIADSTDTLFVAFSEKITFDDDAKEPFYFLDTPQNKNYSVTIREGEYEFIDEKTMKFALDQVNSDAGGIRAGDSIWIHEKDWIGDICESDDGGTENNYQNNPDNRRREVNVVFKAVVIGLDPVTISPLDLGSITNNSSINIIPDDIIELFDLENKLQDLQLQTIVDDEGNTVFIGMLIQIIPDETDLETLKDLFLEGELFIFDAVGNEVISAKPMVFNKKNKTLNYVWNGRNFNNRFVGAGAYLALGECVKWPLGKDSGKPHEKVTKRFMLAVKE